MFNLALYYHVEIKTPENIRVILALTDHQTTPIYSASANPKGVLHPHLTKSLPCWRSPKRN
jgi:hypothetical protein